MEQVENTGVVLYSELEYIDIPSINTTMYRGTHGRERPTHSELHVLVVTLTKGKKRKIKIKKLSRRNFEQNLSPSTLENRETIRHRHLETL
jgi:hypothetical protein